MLNTGTKVCEKATGGNWFLTYDNVIQKWEINRSGIGLPFGYVIRREGQSIIETEANARLMASANSMANALLAISSMQIAENTSKKEVIALCKSVAGLEIEKLTRCER